MSEMIERVAKACGAVIEATVRDGRGWPDGTIERVARAAIEAYQEHAIEHQTEAWNYYWERHDGNPERSTFMAGYNAALSPSSGEEN